MVETIMLSLICLYGRIQEQVIYNDFESDTFYDHKRIIDLHIKIVNYYLDIV